MMMKTVAAWVVFSLVWGFQDVNPSLVIESPASVYEVLAAITGPESGIKILNASLSLKRKKQVGLFHGGTMDNIDLTSGAVLSSAWATLAEGMNENLDATKGDDLGGRGFAPLDRLLPNGTFTKDACILRIDFRCRRAIHDTVTFRFVFGSENYPTVGSSAGRGNNSNEDIVAAFLNGNKPRHNIAVKPGTSEYVSVNTIFDNSGYYRDNPVDCDTIFFTEMNGFTLVLTAKGRVKSQTKNSLLIAVADGGRDREQVGKKGAWVFLINLRCERAPTPVPTASPRPTTTGYPTVAPSPLASIPQSVPDCANEVKSYGDCVCGDRKCIFGAIQRYCRYPPAEEKLYRRGVRARFNAIMKCSSVK